LEGVRLLGLLREKENAYLGSFILDPEDINVKFGAFWNFTKEQGSPELISDYGAQRASLKGLGASGLFGLEPKC